MTGSVCMKVFGPLLFRGPGEFSPTARGPQAMARSLTLPLPSTLAGCIATALGGRPKDPTGGWEVAVQEALGLGNGFLRGPYLLVDDESYVMAPPVLSDGGENLVIGIKNLLRVFEQFRDVFTAEREEVRDVFKKYAKQVKRTESIGIGLKARKKVADEERGLIYAVDFVDFTATFPGKEVKLAMDVHGADLSDADGKAIRLGGEGRLTRIEVGKARLWEEVKKLLERLDKRVYLYTISPSLIQGHAVEVGRVKDGTFVWPDPLTPVRNLMSALTGGRVEVECVIGSLRLLGVGYDLAKNVRKPSYIASDSGCVMGCVMKNRVYASPSETIEDLYRKGLSTRGGNLGYGTFIPVPAQ